MPDDDLQWRLLQYHEGGVAKFADTPDEFWLRSDFGTLTDFDPDLAPEECVEERRFGSHGERCSYACREHLCHLVSCQVVP